MNLIFEPIDLQAASPATVSRNGMVYMEPKSLGWRVLVDSWALSLPETLSEEDKVYIHSLIIWVTEHLLDFIRSNVEEISPTQDPNMVSTLMKLFRCLLKDFDNPEFA